jgi:AraC family transcriptional regulator, activator of mtrCDE
MSTEPPMTDALGQVLRQLRLRASVSNLGRLCGLWAIDASGSGQATFHLVLSGRCWLRVGATPPRELGAGDLVLLPRDAPHLISDGPSAEAVVPPMGGFASTASSTEGTTLVCGQLLLSKGAGLPLLRALPECRVFHASGANGDRWARSLVEQLVREVDGRAPGADAVIERLIDLLFIEALRHHAERAPERAGLLAALADERLERSLRRMHGDLAHPWTVDGLAEIAGMSRSAFSESFRAHLGESPMKYLTRWRLHVAAGLLVDSNASVLEIALQVGYGTEPALARAFRRELGLSPGSLRLGGAAAARSLQRASL